MDQDLQNNLLLEKCKITAYQCPFCVFITKDKLEFLRHHNSHLPQNLPAISPKHSSRSIEKKYLCSMCYRVFEDLESVRSHMIKVS